MSGASADESEGEARPPPEGVLVVDKPRGPTSHDVVGRLRRALGTRRVGHAGTLDPMASGVLVVLAGEATKLAAYLTADDKRYVAQVALGVGTDTLDAEGEITAEGPLPGWLEAELAALAEAGSQGAPAQAEGLAARAAPRIAAAIEAEAARREQAPPVYSAIKVAGRRSYAMARAGEAAELSPRPVEVRSLRLLGASPGSLELELVVTKGYYVRALARDLGAHLGVPAHLTALRRTASGRFTLEGAVPLSAGEAALRSALRPLEQAAAQSLPVARLTEAGVSRARRGQKLHAPDFSAAPPPSGAAAWLDPSGRLVALGAAVADPGAAEAPPSPATPEASFAVLRGFTGPQAAPGDESG